MMSPSSSKNYSIDRKHDKGMRCLHCNTEYNIAQEGGSEKKKKKVA